MAKTTAIAMDNKLIKKVRKLFGVFVPPKKPARTGQTITMEFILQGTVPSKKNQQFATFNHKYVRKKMEAYLMTIPERPNRRKLLDDIMGILREVKPHIENSAKFKQWNEAAKAQIVEQASTWRERFAAHGLSFPITECSISIRYCWRDQIVRDNSNKSESIHDMLKEAGIIVDDNDFCLFKNTAEAERWSKDELYKPVTIIYLTAYKWPVILPDQQQADSSGQ